MELKSYFLKHFRAKIDKLASLWSPLSYGNNVCIDNSENSPECLIFVTKENGHVTISTVS